MKSYLSVILIVISVLMMLSCEKDSNLETPEYSPKLIVHSFISPDDTVLYVHVGATKNLYGQLINYPRKLAVKVSLFDGEKEILFSERDTNGMCKVKYPILPGREYKLMAQCPGYPDVSALTKVPANNPITLSVDTASSLIRHEWGTYIETKFIFKILDIMGEKNYYNVYATSKTTNRFGSSVSPLQYYDDNSEYNFSNTKLVSDNLMDGKTITTHFNLYNTKSDTMTYSHEITGYVLNTDETYFKYHQSLQNYSGTDDPFTEFSPVYSNIEGGLGVFASYVRHKKVMKLK